MLETGGRQAGAAKGPPQLLAVGGELALAGGGDGDEHDRVLQQLFLRGGSEGGVKQPPWRAYEADGIELGDVGVEAQTLGQAAQLFCNVLGVSCLGAVDDQGSTARFRSHGRRWCEAKWD